MFSDTPAQRLHRLLDVGQKVFMWVFVFKKQRYKRTYIQTNKNNKNKQAKKPSTNINPTKQEQLNKVLVYN